LRCKRFFKQFAQNSTAGEHFCCRLLIPTVDSIEMSEYSAGRRQQLQIFIIAVLPPDPIYQAT
jgi:hypothetical protein